jgi:transposase
MVPVEVEQNIEILRQYTLMLQKELGVVAAENARLKGASEAGRQEWLNEKMRDQLSRLQKKFYGSGQESLKREGRPVGHEAEQLKIHGTRPMSDAEKAAAAGITGPILYSYKMSDRELRRESLIRKINGMEEAWEEVSGLVEESREITVTERIYTQAIHRRLKYRLKREYNQSGKTVIVTAPGPVKIRPGSKYSVEFAVSVALDKYGFHLPLERQRRKMEEAGLDVDVKTLYGLCETVAEHCRSVEDRIRQDVFQDFCALHVDESPWPILGEDTNGYMWAISNRRGAVYRFEPTRSGKVAEEMLSGYEGGVLTDGFAGYNRLKKLPHLRLGACWSHARREFYDRLADYPKEATEAVKIIDRLFAVEAKAKSVEQLRELRRTESRKILAEYRDWLFDTGGKHLASSGIRSAINYSLKFWRELSLFATDLSIPLSNNDAERALRHIVMGRKNFNGSKTINGADTAASIYTVIESCKRVGLQPRVYLQHLIDARWHRETPKTPYELAMEKLGPNTRISFPAKSDWQV